VSIFGGGSEEGQPDGEQPRNRGRQTTNDYDSDGMVRVLGSGTFTAADTRQLTVLERETLPAKSSCGASMIAMK
jgi:hypothetical protein